MADLAAARDKITRVAGLLVNRFGHEAPVFELLNGALADLKDDPPVRVKPDAPKEEPAAEEVAEEQPEAEPQKAEPPRSKPQGRGRRR